MQQITTCTTCGTGLLPEARFCRNCGQPVKQLDPNSVTEGTTRLLDTPEPQVPFGQNFSEHHGSLAQPTSRISPQTSPTNRSLEINQKPTNWALMGAVSVAILALVALLIVTLSKRAATPQPTIQPPPVVIRPEVPAIPQPPAPPQGLPTSGAISRAFIYPGAKTTMEASGMKEGNVLQLRTPDAPEKVADWYMQKHKANSVFRTSEPNPTVILEMGDMKIIITEQDDATNILLHQGGPDLPFSPQDDDN